MNKLDQIFSKNIEEYSRSYFDYLKQILDDLDTKEIREFAETLLDARNREATIFFIGNGGSAATSSHFANDLAIGVNDYEKPFKVMSLTDNMAVVSAVANDFGYDDIFSRPLSVYGKAGDLLVGISASGNSNNLIKAFEVAKSKGIRTIAITAFDGGEMKVIADQGIHVPTGKREYGPAEDAHMILDHLVSSYLRKLIHET